VSAERREMIDVTDKLAIQELVARYNIAWDAEDPAGVVACFTEDGVFVDAAANEHQGREAISAFVTRSYDLFGRMRHITSSHLVSPGDEFGLVHRCYVVFVSHPGDERVLDTGEYEDRVERAGDGEWLFKRRVVRFD
jgi:uncharacterized protein (TIGR02246 family)